MDSHSVDMLECGRPSRTFRICKILGEGNTEVAKLHLAVVDANRASQKSEPAENDSAEVKF